ncbi:MAG: cobalt-zinc-cadmium efflux system membrane fusion protein [Planctomycetota bacterium]|jgi:cobalt-zinc-cadmium efflux system membrane fusion protein
MIRIEKRTHVSNSATLLALLALAGSCAPVANQTVQAAESEPEEPEPVAVTVFTEKAQLFMEFPRLVPGHAARFLAHVTVLATGEPVRSGQLRLELSQGPDGSRLLEALKPTRDGLFIPVATFDKPGTYQARILVASEQLTETFLLAPIVVHPNLASAFAAAEAEVEADLPDLVPFLLETQWKSGVLMHQVERRSLTQRLQVLGEVEAPHHSKAVASAPLAGRLLPPPGGELPDIGDQVQEGQVLALLEPPFTTSDSAQLAANRANQDSLEIELSLREFDLQFKASEIGLALQQAKSQLAFSNQALARIETLREKDLGTVAELEAARRDVELAKRAKASAAAMQPAIAEARQRLSKLQTRLAEARTAEGQDQPNLHALIAPISGEIIDVGYLQGEHVESQAAVFRLLDLRRVWIAAHVPEFDLAQIGAAPGALMKFDAYPDRTFDVFREMDGRLIQVGREVDPETRTIELHYESANIGGKLRVGMFADVMIETKLAVDVIALPESSIVMDNGRPVAFALVHGEAFQKRNLELGIRDGEFVEVLSGIQAGDRVVTKGAYLVKLASASPASFGEGHAH